jgi:V/A-type H+-transporting ATPase subunit A
MIREDFLQQSAYHEIDTYSSLKKQYLMLRNILKFHDRTLSALDLGVQLKHVLEMPIRERVARMKETPEKELEKLDKLGHEIDGAFDSLGKK